MASISVAEDALAVTLTFREKLAAAHRDVSVPLAAVRRVRVEPDALAVLPGEVVSAADRRSAAE